MHKAAWDFVESVKAKHPDSFKYPVCVLEVGSRYINGTVRTLFDSPQEYVGLDLSPGPCVDVVSHVADFPIDGGRFDTIISCEALEHDKRWRESLLSMYDLLESGGLLILTAGGTGRAEHGTTATNPADSPATTDYYGNINPFIFWEALKWKAFSSNFVEDKDGDFRFWGVKA